ncbi:MAG: hypothetical protein ACRD7E_19010, partial [Bryobacteraceae bacterium]
MSRKTTLRVKSSEALRPPGWWLVDGEANRLHEWMELAAASLGLEAEPVQTTYAQVHSFLRTCGPAFVQLEFDGEAGFLAIVRARRRSLEVLSPELTLLRISA